MSETMERVLVAGSINTDLVMRTRRAPESGETVTGTEFSIFGGGKGANQAVAAARSGAPTAMLGAVGSDEFGAARLRDLAMEDVDVRYIAIAHDVSSGVAMITVEESGENRIAFVPGATMSISPEMAGNVVAEVRPGVLLATLELPESTLGEIFGKARAVGAVVICNATPEPDEHRELAMTADILIVNETEALALLNPGGAGLPWLAVAKMLSEMGPDIVVVTLGADGAVIVTPSGEEMIPSVPVEVVDTTGAGDAFCGAFAATLLETGNPFLAAQRGVTAGSLATTRAGAQPSMPTRAEIDQAMMER